MMARSRIRSSVSIGFTRQVGKDQADEDREARITRLQRFQKSKLRFPHSRHDEDDGHSEGERHACT